MNTELLLFLMKLALWLPKLLSLQVMDLFYLSHVEKYVN